MKLETLYQLKKEQYQLTGTHEHPARLLAMLLLPKHDLFEPLKVSEGQFYQIYQTEIDEEIKTVMEDFQMTNEVILQYIEASGVSTGNFEHDKIWFVFSKGFGAMHWGLMYHPEKSPEQIYQMIFYHPQLKEIKGKQLVYQKQDRVMNRSPKLIQSRWKS